MSAAAAIGGIIASAFGELAEKAIEKVTGKHPSESDALKSIVERTVRAAVDAGIHQLEAKLQDEIAELGLLVSLQHLADVTKGVDEWFRPKGTIPNLGLTVEVVDEITDEDRAREKASWDSLKTPPEGSSER